MWVLVVVVVCLVVVGVAVVCVVVGSEPPEPPAVPSLNHQVPWMTPRSWDAKNEKRPGERSRPPGEGHPGHCEKVSCGLAVAQEEGTNRVCDGSRGGLAVVGHGDLLVAVRARVRVSEGLRWVVGQLGENWTTSSHPG